MPHLFQSQSPAAPPAAGDIASLDQLNAALAASERPQPGRGRFVAGEGPIGAVLAFVGEQPGDQEDRLGRPFVGPAGQLLDRALADADIPRDASYLTNAVKVFRYEERGGRRLHRKPDRGDIVHFRWWLMKELDLVRPRVVVALGATAIEALVGRALPVQRSRGDTWFGEQRGFITVHPSYLLRLPDPDERARAYARFVADLTTAQDLAQTAQAG